jgi:hypothetical protein
VNNHCFWRIIIFYMTAKILWSVIIIVFVVCLQTKYRIKHWGSTRQGNLRQPKVRFQLFSDKACWVREPLKSYPLVSEISLSSTFSGFLFYFSLNTVVLFTFHQVFSHKIVFHCWNKLSNYRYTSMFWQYFKCILLIHYKCYYNSNKYL